MTKNCSLAGYMREEPSIILRFSCLLHEFIILIDVYYMHNNNNYQCKICWNKVLTFGIGSIQISFRTIVQSLKLGFRFGWTK